MNLIKYMKVACENIKKLSAVVPFYKIPFIFADECRWVAINGFVSEEYFEFEFYKKSRREKEAYVKDREILNNTFNKEDERVKLDNKAQFNKYFEEFLGREYLTISSDDYNLFKEFVQKHPRFIKKPLNEYGGNGVEKIDSSGKDLKAVFSAITEGGAVLIEEIMTQHKDIAKLNPDSINTLRVITMRDEKGVLHIPLANIRIGRLGQCVDNVCAGGMTAAINIKSGVVETPAFDKYCKKYSVHPDTNVPIIGLQIPYWSSVKNTVMQAADKIPNCRYVGWDVVVGDDGNINLIEGNSKPGANLHQLTAGKGLRPIYEKYLGSIR